MELSAIVIGVGAELSDVVAREDEPNERYTMCECGQSHVIHFFLKKLGPFTSLKRQKSDTSNFST